jgi:hypothetical protein
MSQLTTRGVGGGSVDPVDIEAGVNASQLAADLATLLTRIGNPSTDTSASLTISGTLKAILENLTPDVEYVTYCLNSAPNDLLAGYARVNPSTGIPEYFDANNVALTGGTFVVKAQGNQDFELAVEYYDAIATQAGGSPEYLDGHCLRETRFYDRNGALNLTVWDNLTTQTVLTAPPAPADIEKKGGAATGITSFTGYAHTAGTGYVVGDQLLVAVNQEGSVQTAINVTQGTVLSGFAIADLTDIQEDKLSTYISSSQITVANGAAAGALPTPPVTAKRAVIEYEALQTSNDKILPTIAFRVKLDGATTLPTATLGEPRYNGDAEELETADEIADFRYFRVNTQGTQTLRLNVRYYTC